MTTTEQTRLSEAEGHLWALVVWFGGRYDNPYVDRDVAAAAGYVERHLKHEDMTARHREVVGEANDGRPRETMNDLLVYWGYDGGLEGLRNLHAERDDLAAAIQKHRQQIKAREAGRRVSSIAADEQLWSSLDG